VDGNHLVDDTLFEVRTPLGFRVRVTVAYWELIVTVKHPAMAGCQAEVQDGLQNPSEIRQSRRDPNVYLLYKLERKGRWVCVVARRLDEESGFLVTTYPTDAIKEGVRIWPR
jgi:hypothetical protein